MSADPFDFVIHLADSPTGTYSKVQAALAASFKADDYDYQKQYKLFALRVEDMTAMRTFNQHMGATLHDVTIEMAITMAERTGVMVLTGRRAAALGLTPVSQAGQSGEGSASAPSAPPSETGLAVVSVTDDTVVLSDGDTEITLAPPEDADSADEPSAPPFQFHAPPPPIPAERPVASPDNAVHIDRTLNGPAHFTLLGDAGGRVAVITTRIGVGRSGAGGFAASLLETGEILAEAPSPYALATKLYAQFVEPAAASEAEPAAIEAVPAPDATPTVE